MTILFTLRRVFNLTTRQIAAIRSSTTSTEIDKTKKVCIGGPWDFNSTYKKDFPNFYQNFMAEKAVLFTQ